MLAVCYNCLLSIAAQLFKCPFMEMRRFASGRSLRNTVHLPLACQRGRQNYSKKSRYQFKFMIFAGNERKLNSEIHQSKEGVLIETYN